MDIQYNDQVFGCQIHSPSPTNKKIMGNSLLAGRINLFTIN
jgi:hypothetical protein